MRHSLTGVLLSLLLFTIPWVRAMDPVNGPPIPGSPSVARDDSGCAALPPGAFTSPVFSRDVALPANAAANWKSLGPFGGDVADVAASPVLTHVVLAGLAPSSGSGMLFRSTDSAASWIAVGALSGYHVYDIEFAPDGTAYIGTSESIWKSTDNGSSWSQLNLNIGLNDVVLEITIDPNDANRIWVGVDDALGGQNNNVLLSTNAGASWANKTPPLPSPMGCNALAVDPTDSNKILAGFSGSFGGGSVWVSSNGGTSWVNRSSGLPGNPMNDAAHDGTRMYIAGGMQFGSQGVGLYTSTDDGVTWVNMSTTWPSLYINDIEFDPNDNNIILAASIDKGLFLSTDYGASWTFGAGGTGSLSLQEASFEPGSSSDVYLGATSNAVWKSTNAGTAFAPSSVGIGQLNVTAIGSNPNNTRELAIAFSGLNNGGVYTSADNGMTWTLENVPGTRYNMIRFAPDGTLYAISDGPSSIAPEGVYRKDGSVWTSLGPDQGTLFETELAALCFSKNDPDLIVATGADFGVAGFEGTIWVSDDAGVSWTKAYEGAEANESVTDIKIIQDGTDQVMLACFSDFGSNQTGGVLRSTNGGASWSPSSGGIAANARCSSLSHCVDVDTFFVSDNMYGGSEPGLYKTVDAGLSWRSTGFIGDVQNVVANPYIAGHVYITQNNTEKVWMSVDDGKTFTAFNTGLGLAGYTNQLCLKEMGCEILLATSTGSFTTLAEFPLVADLDTVKESSGGTIHFTIDAGTTNAGRTYLLLGSVTGVTPGTPLPGNLAVLPINWDIFTDLVLAFLNTPLFSGFYGVLDGNGQNAAQLSTGPLPSGFAGTRMHYAYALNNYFDYTSNPVMVEIIP